MGKLNSTKSPVKNYSPPQCHRFPSGGIAAAFAQQCKSGLRKLNFTKLLTSLLKSNLVHAAMQLPCNCHAACQKLDLSLHQNMCVIHQHSLHFPKEFRILLAFASSKLKVYWLRRRYFILICKSCFPGHSRHDRINASG